MGDTGCLDANGCLFICDRASGMMMSDAVTSTVPTSSMRSWAQPFPFPPVAEGGYLQFQASTWFGVAAPAQTRDDGLKVRQAAADRTIQAPGFRSNFAAPGLQMERLAASPKSTVM